MYDFLHFRIHFLHFKYDFLHLHRQQSLIMLFFPRHDKSITSRRTLLSNKQKLSDAFGKSISKEEALSLIKSEPEAYERFQNFAPNEREKILAFIQGQRGLKITYDPFFRKIFSPRFHPERLESFLSELLQQKVHILKEFCIS